MEYLIILAAAFGVLLLIGHVLSSKGATGELAVSSEIKSIIKNKPEYRLFSNIILKTPDGTTQIDHVLISPYGIFVIETKNYKGWIFGGEHQKRWTQSLKRSYKLYKIFNQYTFQFQNPLHQNYKHVKAVERFLGVDLRYIFNVVVFVGENEFMTPMPDNVMTLHDLNIYIRCYVEKVLDSVAIEKYCQKIAELEKCEEDEHVENLERNTTSPRCPRCGKEMVVRVARKGIRAGAKFWGCPSYPSCKVTKNMVI